MSRPRTSAATAWCGFRTSTATACREFLCIANFSQHHEVLLNEKGRLKLAWAHGWDTSVTTQTIATTWPDPPIADVDGDGKLEMVVNLFASDGQPRWMTRIYDALTGLLKATARDRIATYLSDVDGDGAAELLADMSQDPTLTEVQGAACLKCRARTARNSGGRMALAPRRSCR